MEFAGFADDLFDETGGRQTKQAPISYNAKIIEECWFNKELDNDVEDDQQQNKLRFSADHAYYTDDIEGSLTKYQECLTLVNPTNITVWRDLNEAIARCLARLGRMDEAVEIVEQVLVKAHTFEQRTSAWYTAARVYSQLGLIDRELVVRQALAMLHSSNPTMWLRLGELYAILAAKYSANASTNVSHQNKIKQYVCYTRACLLLDSVYFTATGLTKERNQEEQDKLRKLIEELDLQDIDPEKFDAEIRASVFESPAVDDMTDHQLALQINPETEGFSQDFEEKFFSFEQTV